MGGAVPTGMAGVAGTAAGSAEDAKVTPVMFLSWCPFALHCPSHFLVPNPLIFSACLLVLGINKRIAQWCSDFN